MKYVLVVEDDPITLKIICATLEKHGFSAIKATNGNDALLHLKGHDIHAVLLDLNLPDMNGIEVLKQIRNHPVFHSVAIIIVTENDDKLEAILGLEIGA
ncbi:MAG TPA: response regulator, partial [Bacillota bacterium]|nr:response regulator [Bacillota bacterium]